MHDPNLSRRDVLKAGCAAAAGFAAPAFFPSTARGNGDTPPPSERVTLGHIGVGGRGSFLINAAQRAQGIQSLAVADCYEDRRESAAAAIQGTAYADFRRILDRKDIDGVIIATPDHWHVPIAVMAARGRKGRVRGKAVGADAGARFVCAARSFTSRNESSSTAPSSERQSTNSSAANWFAAGSWAS